MTAAATPRRAAPQTSQTRRVSAAELADRGVEQLGLLEIAHVTSARDHDEVRFRDRVLELAGDAERRARVQLPPDQQGRYSDARQQITLVGLGHHMQRSPHALGANVGGHRLQERNEPGRRTAGEQPRKRGVEQVVRRRKHLPDALDPGAHLLLGQRPLPAGVGVDEEQGGDELGMVALRGCRPRRDQRRL
jgi:hypothetical protein